MNIATRVARRRVIAVFVFLALAVSALGSDGANNKGVKVVANEAARRVDVTVDGKPFTSYIWPETLKKPVLFPIRTADGVAVTRGWPLEPRPGERVDHPHQVGLWFNYGDVNGNDFWNNSDAVKPGERGKLGTIRHIKVNKTTSGKDTGTLDVTMEWILEDGTVALREDTTFVFHAGPNIRSIDRITKLTAQTVKVLFRDNKEGVIGMRVARQLEQPATRPEVFTDASGKATSVPVLDNKGVTGLYTSSEGKKGDDVWGTRAKWTMLNGKIGDEAVTLAILDHSNNPGYPTYWHARGYGLFAANPLGQKAMSDGKQELNFTLEPRQSVTFRHRVLIISEAASPEKIETDYRRFLEEVK